MGLIDISILAIVGMGAIRGYLRGFIRQLASMAGLIVGFLAARAFYLIGAERLSMYIPDTSMTTLQVVAFVTIWVVIPFCFMLIASFLTRTAEMLSLGMVNRFLGLLFGTAKWVLMVGLLINVIDFVDTDNRFVEQARKEESMLYYPVKNIIGDFFPAAKEITNEYITL